MNTYERIYSLLSETVTVKKKKKSTRPTAGIFKSDAQTAIAAGEAEAKQRRGRVGVLRRRARHAGIKAGKAVSKGTMDVRQAVDDIGDHELATAHHGGGTTRTRREYTKGMTLGARKK